MWAVLCLVKTLEGTKGRNWGNCNSIINKAYFKKNFGFTLSEIAFPRGFTVGGEGMTTRPWLIMGEGRPDEDEV